ncbi:hypothetical protein J4419_01355 [Candidatus Woesearchaeota archaeon]|nr:hypothetical protein [Candidatus Woesearchaeota archaeon]
MPTAEESRKLQEQISSKRAQVNALQTELRAINERKEKHFREKTELSERIHSLIEEIKRSRQTRDTLTKDVRQFKQDRDKQNEAVKASVARLKEFEAKRDELLKKHNIKDPTGILRQIEILERKVETDPMSFDREKGIMKQIKELKKKLKDAQEVGNVLKEIRDLSKLTDEQKRVAQESHRRVQGQAKESQERHENLLVASKEIDEIKVKEQQAFQAFIDHKKQFNQKNEQVKQLLAEVHELQAQASGERQEQKERAERKQKETLKERKHSVEEKIKKGQKLTTEDILAFQGADTD